MARVSENMTEKPVIAYRRFDSFSIEYSTSTAITGIREDSVTFKILLKPPRRLSFVRDRPVSSAPGMGVYKQKSASLTIK